VTRQLSLHPSMEGDSWHFKLTNTLKCQIYHNCQVHGFYRYMELFRQGWNDWEVYICWERTALVSSAVPCATRMRSTYLRKPVSATIPTRSHFVFLSCMQNGSECTSSPAAKTP
jgi:hypothetical protein